MTIWIFFAILFVGIYVIGSVGKKLGEMGWMADVFFSILSIVIACIFAIFLLGVMSESF